MRIFVTRFLLALILLLHVSALPVQASVGDVIDWFTPSVKTKSEINLNVPIETTDQISRLIDEGKNAAQSAMTHASGQYKDILKTSFDELTNYTTLVDKFAGKRIDQLSKEVQATLNRIEQNTKQILLYATEFIEKLSAETQEVIRTGGSEVRGVIGLTGSEARSTVALTGKELRASFLSAGYELDRLAIRSGRVMQDVVESTGNESIRVINAGTEGSRKVVLTSGDVAKEVLMTGGEVTQATIYKGGQVSKELMRTGSDEIKEVLRDAGGQTREILWTGEKVTNAVIKQGGNVVQDITKQFGVEIDAALEQAGQETRLSITHAGTQSKIVYKAISEENRLTLDRMTENTDLLIKSTSTEIQVILDRLRDNTIVVVERSGQVAVLLIDRTTDKFIVAFAVVAGLILPFVCALRWGEHLTRYQLPEAYLVRGCIFSLMGVSFVAAFSPFTLLNPDIRAQALASTGLAQPMPEMRRIDLPPPQSKLAPLALPTPIPTPTPTPTPTPYMAASSEKCPIATTSGKNTPAESSGRQIANEVIEGWFNARKQVFGPPFDKEVAAKYTTGKFYKELVDPTGIIATLKSDRTYYEFRKQEIKAFDVEVKGHEGIVFRVSFIATYFTFKDGNLKESVIDKDLCVKFLVVDDAGIWKISDWGLM